MRIVLGAQSLAQRLRDHTFADGTSPELVDVRPTHRAFAPMVNAQAYDLSELAIVTFLQAFAAGRPVVLLPVTALARFQHHCLVSISGAVGSPADLPGRTVGVRSWSQTTGVWVRALISDDHGIDLRTIRWRVYEGSHVSGVEDPDFVARAPEGAKLVDDFQSGAVDAAILGNELPDDPRVTCLIDDPPRAAAAWYARTGAVPINHVVVVSREYARKHPERVHEAFQVMLAAKPAPRPTSNPDFAPCGFDAMRPSLELASRYAQEQGLLARSVSVDEVIAATVDVLGSHPAWFSGRPEAPQS